MLQVYTIATYVNEWQIYNLKISHTVGSETVVLKNLEKRQTDHAPLRCVVPFSVKKFVWDHVQRSKITV